MAEGLPKQFSSPEEELQYLREELAKRERELLQRSPHIDEHTFEAAAKAELREYSAFTPRRILAQDYELPEEHVTERATIAEEASDPVSEIMRVAEEKGIRNALSVLERTNHDNPYLIDEVHRALIEHIRGGKKLEDVKDAPPWHVLHLTLFEVTLPELKGANDREYQLGELVGMMEQFFAGMRTVSAHASHNHFVLEIAVADNSDDIIFFVAVPHEFISLFEKQILSLFPHAVLTERVHDYNIFVPQGHTIVSNVSLKKNSIYPIKTHEHFQSDPLLVILNSFSQIEREGGGAALQFVIHYPKHDYRKVYEEVIKKVEKGMKPKEAIRRSTLAGELAAGLMELFKTEKKEGDHPLEVHNTALEQFREKQKNAVVEVNMRVVVSASLPERAAQIHAELASTFNQFAAVDGNEFVLTQVPKSKLALAEKAFSFRDFSKREALPLNLTELSTLIHFPGNGVTTSPQFKQSQSSTAAAPTDMPTAGTLLGINRHRNAEKPIYVTDKDRMRHFYVIGQTGTGKSVFLKNLIIQDIQNGHGVCMIDPHGTDIEDVLGAVPPERERDVIYFDPSNLDRPIALNMLEYDPRRPEQKTFVVNELFSIFQKLYGANPESMGPMFEQYFRNATLLVMEDPESGNTLMDISRVMADAKYRRMKLERARNPVVVQFWREIATKAGGEASLENIVPYIVSKFDVFTANDYMRPIIGQQHSAFNFRDIMDSKKILLVNLSKGRLGEINANLIGMIIIGKLLMAALSRVDTPSLDFAPFFLHIDEFQNVSTPSIASILSEARKYKLSLTMAHQFIAQLDPKIKDAVFGNVGSLATFRVGYEDAAFLENQFTPVFDANDLINVPNYQAFLRILANGVPTKPFSIATMPPPETNLGKVAALKSASSERYGRAREEIEAEIAARYQKESVAEPNLTAL